MIERFLHEHGIAFERFDHPAVFTCEEAAELPSMPGASTKNLFVYDARTEAHALVVVGCEKNVDLKRLKAMFGWSKISFASPERLRKFLRVEPGSVTILGLINDTERVVAVYLDAPIAAATSVQCHPLVNTATFVIDQQGMFQFLKATGHTAHVIAVPERTTERGCDRMMMAKGSVLRDSPIPSTNITNTPPDPHRSPLPPNPYAEESFRDSVLS